MRNVVRFIASVAAASLTRLLIVQIALSIGMERGGILFFGGILVGGLVGWQFVWKANMWQRAPEKELDRNIDVE